MNKLFLSVTFLSSLILAGCGGAGGLGGANARISASPNPSAYGAPVHITWSTSGGIEIVDSNFGLSSGDLSGNFDDNPGVNTTYTFTARVQNDGHAPFDITKSVTVKVTKSSKTVLVVGNSAVSGPNQLRDSMATITSGAVTVASSLPGTLSQDVVIIHPSANLSTGDVSTVQGYLSSNKGVVLIGDAVLDLSGGNISSIGGMLAGATHQASELDETFRSTSGLVPISSRYFGFKLSPFIADPFNGLVGVSASADRLIESNGVTSAFAYPVPGGGKIGYASYDGVGSDQVSAGYDLALRVIARWCMDRS